MAWSNASGASTCRREPRGNFASTSRQKRRVLSLAPGARKLIALKSPSLGSLLSTLKFRQVTLLLLRM